MKNYILIIALFMSACSSTEGDSLSQKKAELAEKEKSLAQLRAEITQLKNEIYTLDTNARSTAIAVRALQVSKAPFRNPFQIQGLVESDQNVLVSAEVPAHIVKIHVTEGQKVSTGQLIATMDGAIIRSQVEELENALNLAETVYLKQKGLWDQHIGSEIQYLQAKNNYENLQKSIATAKKQLDKYTIVSPINGTVDEIMVNEGELVGSLTGGPVVRIVNLSQMKIKAKVSEKYIGQIKTGQKVDVYFPSLNLTMEEKIEAVSNVIDINNRTFTVYVKPTKNLNLLKPNLLAMITAYEYEQTDAISIPTKLIRNDGEQDYVFCVKTNGNKQTVAKTQIDIDKKFASESIINSGLNSGDLLITEGYDNVIDGDEVKIIKD